LRCPDWNSAWHLGRALSPFAATAMLVMVDPASALGRLGRADNAALAYATQPSRTVTEGVYTETQAARGAAAYTRACTYCHRADLSGNEDGAPSLRGTAFGGRWKDRPLSELYFVIKETMPQDEPRSLSDSDCVDIVAYILSRNDARAGQTELTADTAALASIRFTGAAP